MRTMWILSVCLVAALLALTLPVETFAAGGCSCTAAAPTEPGLTHRSHSYPPAQTVRPPMRRGTAGTGFSDAGRKVRGQY